MRDGFSLQVKDELAKRVGHLCSNPCCRQPTSGPQTSPVGAVNIGVAAHLTAASPGGPRHDTSLSAEQRSSSSNGIWLCQTCAKLVDNDVSAYTIERLRKWRADAEAESARALKNRRAATIAEQAAKALGIKELVPTIYQDLLQPAAQEMGQHLVVVARAVGIAFAPLKAVVWGYDRISDYASAAVAVKLATKPPGEIRSPDPIIAGPAIQNMVFAAEAHHLREMYATLLAHAMHSPSAPRVHPSFVQVIQQLSSVEAQLLQKIAESHHGEDVLFQESLQAGGENVGGDYISTQWQAFCAKCDVSDHAIVTALYHNLIRLGIFMERTEADSEYIAEGIGRYTMWDAHVDTTTIRFVMLTEYGSLFLDACVRDVLP
jgi:hypothetical protein